MAAARKASGSWRPGRAARLRSCRAGARSWPPRTPSRSHRTTAHAKHGTWSVIHPGSRGAVQLSWLGKPPFSALRSARIPVNLTGSPISYANRLFGSPITSQSTVSQWLSRFRRNPVS